MDIFVREFGREGIVWLENKLIRENRVFDFDTVLSVRRHFGKTNLLDPLGFCGKFLGNSLEGETCSSRNVIAELVFEEIPTFLSINTIHSDKIS